MEKKNFQLFLSARSAFCFCLTQRISYSRSLEFHFHSRVKTTKEEGRKQQKLTMDNVNPLTSGTVLLRSVSIFLSNRRQSKQLKEQAQKNEKKKRTKTLSKMDEQMGKLHPKQLESLKRKTHFNK